eukprot:scaffold19799_cov69-Phaeocystis_antarctica.AAC.6
MVLSKRHFLCNIVSLVSAPPRKAKCEKQKGEGEAGEADEAPGRRPFSTKLASRQFTVAPGPAVSGCLIRHGPVAAVPGQPRWQV